MWVNRNGWQKLTSNDDPDISRLSMLYLRLGGILLDDRDNQIGFMAPDHYHQLDFESQDAIHHSQMFAR